MKLIFINRFYYPDHSATSQLLSSLATRLSKRGWRVNVVTSRLCYDNLNADLPARENVEGVQVHRVWTSSLGRTRLVGRAVDYLTFYISATWRLWRLARKDDIVVAKTDPPMLSVAASGVTNSRSARLVNWQQDIFPEVACALGVRGMSGAMGWFLREIRDRSLRHAKANVVLGKLMRARIRKAKVASSSIYVIPNWECGETIKPISRVDNPLRAAWGLGDKFVIGYSGNMGRAHDFETIVKAAVALKTREDIAFVWVGDGAQRPWLEEEARRLNLSRFIFKPYQPRACLSESLSLPDVHVVSLRPELEGLIVPSKCYAIAAAGRPALFIGDCAGESAKLLRKHGCGYSLDPSDHEGLVSRILELHADERTREAMGVRARRALEEHYEKKQAFVRWETLLQQIARTAPPRKTWGDYGSAKIGYPLIEERVHLREYG